MSDKGKRLSAKEAVKKVPFLMTLYNTCNFKKYQKKRAKLAEYLPWSYFVGNFADGVVLLKSGALMRCYSFICPDLGSASADSIEQVSFYFNESLKRLESRWMVQFEAQRGLTGDYPGSKWAAGNIAGYIIDSRRKEVYRRQKVHFTNQFYLTFTYQMENAIYKKAKNLFYREETDDDDENGSYYDLERCRNEIADFIKTTDALIAPLRNKIYLEKLDADECATYMHASVSCRWHSLHVPHYPCLCDHYITDVDVNTNIPLEVGDTYVGIISIHDFPQETYPAIFDALNYAQIEYRWSTRWIAESREEADKRIKKLQSRFYGSRKSWATALSESIMSYESGKEDPSASEFERDTKEAKIRLSNGEVCYGYYTCTCQVWDKSQSVLREKVAYIISLINSIGFTAKEETFNAFEAWCSMQPGNAFANIRQYYISTGNASHLVPLSSIWEGLRVNKWTDECFRCPAPLLICSSDATTAFFLNLNIGDLGHTFIFGISGGGKSTHLCLLESQFTKYRGANVIILDKDRTARGITMAHGGVYAEPGTENVAFQPLRDLESESDISWAAEFIKLLLIEQGTDVNAAKSEAIVAALKQLKAEKPPEKRTITSFQQYCNYTDPLTGTNTIREAVQPYTIGGEYGSIFDAEDTTLALSKWVMIEMGTLMKMGEKCVTPALMFLFRFIEKMYTTRDGYPTGDPTILVLDEAWVFLDNEFFAKTIEEWLVTLRKKRVFCVFATQEVAKVAKSRLATTIISQCLTKIYGADPQASSQAIAAHYRTFELTADEIKTIARMTMKRDYFYKSPLGSRKYSLDLDALQLALLVPDHALLDELEKEYGRNSRKPLAIQILQRKHITGWEKYFKNPAAVEQYKHKEQ